MRFRIAVYLTPLRLAEDVKCWPLFETSPIPKWTSGKLVLIGDAAHPVWNSRVAYAPL